jgi:molybdopterin synthase sulfur carrier subunit
VKLQIVVRFFTSLREITGTREENVEFPEDKKVTIDVVLRTLNKKYGRDFHEYVYDGETGQVRSFLQFLVNGKSASTVNGLETRLEEGDVLAILPPVGGG